MPSEDDDATLLSRARDGDEEAFRVVYERHRDPVFRFAYRLVGSVGAAEDIAHDCFLGLIDRPERFDPMRASLRTYLCGAARHLAFQHLRRRGMQVDLEDGEATSVDAEVLDRMLGDEVAVKVARAVARLPPLQREALVLFEYEEMTLAEIAEVAGVTEATVSARLSRARERLRAWLVEIADEVIPEATRRRS
jgi:RNA polymerase sigma-70 factor (ECF subfamily)